MKHFWAYFFLMVFSIQILPVKEIGKILFKGMVTEEVHEVESEADDGCSLKLKKDPELFRYQDVSPATYAILIDGMVVNAIHDTEKLPRVFVSDILTPPPNGVS